MTTTTMATPDLVQFLTSSARFFRAGGWVFTGFNWPVLAARVARRLEVSFVQVLEPGAALDRDTPRLLSSTTDFQAYGDAVCWEGSTLDVLTTLVPRCRVVMVDAANVDLCGRTNTHAIGPVRQPKVRLPGGGGGPDVMARASHLVLLHGGRNVKRVVARVEHVTGAPGDGTATDLVTRWGQVTLGPNPRLATLAPDKDAEAFASHLRALGVAVSDPEPAVSPTDAEAGAVEAVLTEASTAGYRIR